MRIRLRINNAKKKETKTHHNHTHKEERGGIRVIQIGNMYNIRSHSVNKKKPNDKKRKQIHSMKNMKKNTDTHNKNR